MNGLLGAFPSVGFTFNKPFASHHTTRSTSLIGLPNLGNTCYLNALL